MISLTFAEEGEKNIIKRIGGAPDVKKHLEDMGFVVGAEISVITSQGGNLIINIKETRVAISKEMAMKIMV